VSESREESDFRKSALERGGTRSPARALFVVDVIRALSSRSVVNGICLIGPRSGSSTTRSPPTARRVRWPTSSASTMRRICSTRPSTTRATPTSCSRRSRPAAGSSQALTKRLLASPSASVAQRGRRYPAAARDNIRTAIVRSDNSSVSAAAGRCGQVSIAISCGGSVISQLLAAAVV
jgi:hypothetical protein